MAVPRAWGLEHDAPSLASLVDAARAGDAAAFEALVARRIDRTYRTARAILGNDADARDAVQDAWLSAWRQLARLRAPGLFDAWVDRIVVNACRMLQRSRGRVREIPMADDFDPPSRAQGPDGLAERDLVERAFARLTLDQRTVLVLHHLHHQPVSAIAATLAIPEGTVKWRLHKARTALDTAYTTLALEGDR